MKLLIAALAVTVFGAFAFVPAPSVGALDPLENACNNGGSSDICANKDDDATDLIGIIVNVMLFIVGTLAVIMIIFAGIQYTISSGDAGKVAKAKNTLTYSIVGLIVAFIAFALVNWVFRLF